MFPWSQAEGLRGWREGAESSQGRVKDGGGAGAQRQAWPRALTALPLPCAHPGPPWLCPRPAVSWPSALPKRSQPQPVPREQGAAAAVRVQRGASVGVDGRLPGAA